MNTKRETGLLDSLTAFLSQSTVQAVLGILILLVLSVVAYYALAKLRGSSSEDTEFVDSLEKNFEEMRSGGDISEAEYRRISASLKGGVNAPSLSKETNT
jgi:uncharacterized membrane protein